MTLSSLTRLSDTALTLALESSIRDERRSTAHVVAHIAEFDARRLYAPAGYPSMHAYCLGKLHLSRDAAFRRIRAARKARHHRSILPMLADGRLHLTAIVLLSYYLTRSNAEELLGAAVHKSREEIERLLAERFPRADVPTRLRRIRGSSRSEQVALAPVGESLSLPTSASPTSPPAPVGELHPQLAPAPVGASAEGLVLKPRPVQDSYPRIKPLAPERFALQVTIGQATHDKLRRAQTLLGYQVASNDVAGVLDRALDALIAELEKRKLAATSRPRVGAGTSRKPRYVPAPVKRAVSKRDGGRCTFVSLHGHRCEARADLEWDHVRPVARGGTSTVENIRLRCRAHNQLAAERVYGIEFMTDKRDASRVKQVARAYPGAQARSSRSMRMSPSSASPSG
jgi:hypothetical protein